jgi:hypothetical protein
MLKRSIGMNDLLRKVHLTRSLNNMRLLFPNDFDFYPKTWFLPEQNQQFRDDVRYIHQLDKKNNRSLTTFIVKPSGLLFIFILSINMISTFFLDGSQGEGIYLLRDPAHCIVTNRPHVIQGLFFSVSTKLIILFINVKNTSIDHY